MSAETLRDAAAQMHENAKDNRCSCDESRCEDNWYSNFLASVADWLDEVAWRSEHLPKQYRAAKHALAVANTYLET